MPLTDGNSRYLVGIDLGTTHTVVAYADSAEGPQAPIKLFEIEQLVGPGEVMARPLLPSVRYHPAAGELDAGDVQLPWPSPALDDPVERPIIGEWTRKLGAKSQGRLVASAKSWLCHGGVDRTAAILPWGAAADIPKISPLLASASYLAHVRAAWNHRFADYPLEQQAIVITVPASFDEAARSLTVEAGRLAGLSNMRLLEEPQAVCYDWLWRHRADLQKTLSKARLLLVCDLGGGTTDLTLIKIEPGADEPKLTRIGVGDHLMLGGDNIDLTLAHLAESRLMEKGSRLSSADLFQLLEQCRSAKERLLAEEAPESARITLLGAGAKLIGGARSTELGREEVRAIVLDGFFPSIGLHDYPERKRSGVVEFGLPYVADPAISKHIAAFLDRHQQAARDALGDPEAPPVPDAILLNGGVFRSEVIAQRLMNIIASWRAGKLHQLDNQRPEFAVACGAVAYGMARRGYQLKIGGGSARSYFLIVEGKTAKTQQGVCLLPRGSEEGQAIHLADRTFSLRLGKPVRFHLVSSTEDTPYQPGDLVELDDERFLPLPPLAVALDRQNLPERQEVDVQLVAALTEVGTLKIQCVTPDNAQRWNVEFQLRQKTSAPTVLSAEAMQPRLPEAKAHILRIYGKKTKEISPRMVKGLRGELEKMLNRRADWDTPLLRELFGALLEGMKHRRRSPDHERTWLSLAGYCLRPGFGYPLDDWRMEQLWQIYDEGIQYVNEAQNWSEWWTLWRRVAGGLSQKAQARIFQDLKDYIDPATSKRGKIAAQSKQRSYEDMVRLAAVLEHLPVDDKIQLGEWLLARLQKAGEPEQSGWALGRVGSRVPFHGSSHNVVPKEKAAEWIGRLFDHDWKKKVTIAFAATLMARLSGDRERDIEEALRRQVIERLRMAKAPASWLEMITEVTELSEADAKRIYGEALPPGLKLIA